MTHSALPWKQFGHGDMWVGSDEPAVGYSYGGAVANCEMDSQGYAKSAANAAYIVKACNAYPELREALIECLAYVEECESDHGTTACGERARRVLSALSPKPPAPTCDDFVGGRTDSEST